MSTFLNDTDDGPFALYTQPQREAIYAMQRKYRAVRVMKGENFITLEGIERRTGPARETKVVFDNGEEGTL